MAMSSFFTATEVLKFSLGELIRSRLCLPKFAPVEDIVIYSSNKILSLLRAMAKFDGFG